MNPVAGPMQGVKVLDIGTMLAAPLAGAMLADQGAQVIKIEPPGIGDVMRFIGATCNGVSAIWQGVNRGKRSLALDLKAPEGLAVFKRLVADADIVMHNFRPGVAEKLGVDYDSLTAVNADLIYLSVTGFGHQGPYAGKAAYDNVIQAFTGVAFSQADVDTGEPTQYYQIFADKISALYGAQALSAALFARERGQGGQHIQLAMVDAVVSFLWPDVSGVGSFDSEEATPGIDIARGVKLIKFKNGYGQAAPVNDAHFHGWCEAFGVDSSAPELATVGDRMAHREMMEEIGAQVMANALELDVEETIAKLEALDVPCARAMSLAELPGHPQMQANGTFVRTEHPQAGTVVEPRTPANFSATPAGVGAPSVNLGANSDEILGEIGYDADAIQRMRDQNILG